MEPVKIFKPSNYFRSQNVRYILYKGVVYHFLNETNTLAAYYTEEEFKRFFVIEKMVDITNEVISDFQYYDWIERIENEIAEGIL